MYRFLLTPRWWGINLFAVLAIPVCLFMGSWQLSRFDARVHTQQEQQRTADDAAHAKAAPLASLLPVDMRTSGRVAEATGHYDADHQLLVPDRRLGERNGFYVLDLLRPDAGKDGKDGKASKDGKDSRSGSGDGNGGGKALPVVRGWLPGDADPGRVPAPPRGEVTVKGALQASESADSPGVEATGGLPKGEIGMISAATLVNVVPYDVYDAWITVQDTPKGSPLRPVPPAQPDDSGLSMKAFQNLGYTGEWFVFAGFVVFMWFRFFRRDRELAKDAALGLIPEASDPSRDPSREPEDDAGRSRSPASTA